jgi:hypothetical protein
MLVEAKQPAIRLYYVTAVVKAAKKMVPLERDKEPETKTFYCRDPTMVRCPFCGSVERYRPRELATKLLRELPPTEP